MPDTKQPPSIVLTHASAPMMSRHCLLQWVNSVVDGEYKKIEELCSGTVGFYISIEILLILILRLNMN